MASYASDETISRIVETYSSMLLRLACTRLDDPADAEDVVQEVFLKLYTARGEFQSEAHVKNWLVKVTVNTCRNVFRTPWRKVEDIEEYAQTLAFETPEQSDLFLAVNSLDRKYRIAVHLYYFEGYSVKEIGEILGVSENTVSTRLARARGKLKAILSEA